VVLFFFGGVVVGGWVASASVRRSVWKRKMRSFSYVDRVGVALERCPGIPSFVWRLARTRRENLWFGSSCAAIHGTSTNKHGAH